MSSLSSLLNSAPSQPSFEPEPSSNQGSFTSIEDDLGNQITPDGVPIPSLPVTDLGLGDNAQPQEYIVEALKDDSISEILLNDEHTMFVVKGVARYKVEGFQCYNPEEYHDMLTKHFLSLATSPVKPIGNNYVVECQIKLPIPGQRPVMARFHALTPPVVATSAEVTIAKMPRSIIKISDMITSKTLARNMSDFIIEAIRDAKMNVIFSGNTGSGKELPEHTSIISLRDNICDYREIKDLIPGKDYAFSMDGNPVLVTDLIDNGMKTTYILKLDNGLKLRAGKEHLWVVASKVNGDLQVKTTEELMSGKWFIPPAKPLQFPALDCTLDPYYVGATLATEGLVSGLSAIPKELEFGSIEARTKFIEGLENGELYRTAQTRIASTLGRNPWMGITKVEKTKRQERMYCISVDSEDGTYLHTKRNIVTHNTTLMRAILPHIYNPSDRVGVVEDVRELFVPLQDVTYLTTTPKIPDEKGGVTMDYNLRQLMRMRISSIIVGECRGPEADAFLQACNTGATKSMLTMHAESAEKTLDRLADFVMRNGTNASEISIKRQIAQAVDLIVYLEKDAEGNRHVKQIAEVGDVVTEQGRFQTSTIFEYDLHTGQFRFSGAPGESFRKALIDANCEKCIKMFNYA